MLYVGGVGMVILSLFGLAILDAMNPFSIVAMALLLATDRPLARGWAFILGTLAVYFAFGIMLVEGWTVALAALVPLLPQWLIGGALFLVGLACFAFAVHCYRQDLTQGKGALLDKVLTLPTTAAFAVASTLSDLPTAVPYFAAAALIPEMADTRLEQYLWLMLYCLIYVAPLCLMLGILVAWGDKAAFMLSGVQRGIAWSFRFILAPTLLVIGVGFLWQGASRLLMLI